LKHSTAEVDGKSEMVLWHAWDTMLKLDFVLFLVAIEEKVSIF
jgi:hypothetical protein